MSSFPSTRPLVLIFSKSFQGVAKIFRVDFGATATGARASDRILYATFYRTHGHDDNGHRVPFNEDSWAELIENIAKVELVDPIGWKQVRLNFHIVFEEELITFVL